MKLVHRRFCLVLLMLGACVATADEIDIPNTLVNGEVADADEVNANFDALVSESNAQNARIGAAEGSINSMSRLKQNRIVGTCEPGTAVSEVNVDGSVVCDTGLTGPQGAPGPAGPPGPQGATGETGAQGPAGVGFTGQQYYTVGPGDFVPSDTNNRITTFLGNQHGVRPHYTNNAKLYAAVHLPQGARINQITGHVHDTEVDVDIRFRLLRKIPNNFSASTAGTEVTVSGSSGFQSGTNDANHTVDNSNRHYFLEVTPIGGNWSGTVSLAIQFAMIRYTLE